MVFGYQQGSGGGYRALGNALNNDSANSEKLRIEAAKRQREREEKERAKMQLASLEQKRDHAKLELSHHQTEVRRLISEIEHDSRAVQDLEHALKQVAEKEHTLRGRVSDFDHEAQTLEKELLEKRKESDNTTNELHKKESELQKLQQEVARVKNEISAIGSEIQKLGLTVRQNEIEKRNVLVEADHAKADHMVKEKDLDAKKRSLTFMQDKKAHAIAESDRLTAEIMKMENEIRALSAKVK